eukprot:9462907-Pyramimonas_sp.AAC.2
MERDDDVPSDSLSMAIRRFKRLLLLRCCNVAGVPQAKRMPPTSPSISLSRRPASFPCPPPAGGSNARGLSRMFVADKCMHARCTKMTISLPAGCASKHIAIHMPEYANICNGSGMG